MNLKATLISLFVLLISATAFALDCNLNGVDDQTDISNTTSKDCNTNSIPYECDMVAGGFQLSSVSTPTLNPLSSYRGNSISFLSGTPLDVDDFNGDGKADIWLDIV